MKKVIVFILALTMIFSASSVSFATDSYTAYFSEEREFIVNDDTYNWSTYFYSDKENGYLYSHNVDTNKKALIFPRNVTEHYLWGNNLFCVIDGKNIVKITITGQNPQTILTTAEDIKQIYVNDDLIFYLMDNTIYRYHINSKFTDKIISNDSILYFYPYSNFVIEWEDNNGNIYKSNLKNRSTNPILIDEYTFITNIFANAVAASPVFVHGKQLPYGNYGHSQYYTQTGQKCTCHYSDHTCSIGKTCPSCIYLKNGAKGWGMQCNAFASEVYAHIWGSYVNESTYIDNLDSTANVRMALWKHPSGSLIRTIKPSTGAEHSFIVADVTTTSVTVYDANNPGNCQISFVTLYFSDLASLGKRIKYSFTGNHNFGTTYTYDSRGHWTSCTHNNCNGKLISSHNYEMQGNYQVCQNCGYSVLAAKGMEQTKNV